MTILTNRFDDALRYAAIVHRNQRRKGTDVPYLSHLLGVASLVLENGGDEGETIAALLHDAAEDKGGTRELDQIQARFGSRVAEIVEACSDSLERDPAKKPPWHERKVAYHRHLRESGDPSVLLVSAADKLHNARATLTDVRTFGRSVWKRFSATREDALWNYRELLKIYAAASKTDERLRPLVRELRRVVRELAG